MYKTPTHERLTLFQSKGGPKTVSCCVILVILLSTWIAFFFSHRAGPEDGGTKQPCSDGRPGVVDHAKPVGGEQK